MRNLFSVLVQAAIGLLCACGGHRNPPPDPISSKGDSATSALESKVPLNPLKNLYFGDLHVHTSLSFDAYLAGTLTSPDEAYQYAEGKTIVIFGRPVKLRRPLDFCAVTDHSELMGETYSMITKGAKGNNSLVAAYFRSVFNTDSPLGVDTAKQRSIFNRLLKKAADPHRTHPFFFRGYGTTKSAWNVTLAAAEKHYMPGKFTTLAGFEWTLSNGFAHLHRNIIFRDMNVPDFPVSSIEARDEEQLWHWMAKAQGDGAILMAIPHNTNLAEGGAFRDTDPRGAPISKEYAQMRQDFERLVEVHQTKGNSEVHPDFWKNDEFAGFENYSLGRPQKNNYVRYALERGIQLKKKLGVNPFKMGMIGSTDTHSGTPGNTEEDDEQIGNQGILDIDPKNRHEADWALDQDFKVHQVVNPGGLVAVWAKANTRGEIYDALYNREVYATSGNRIRLRFFGGKDFDGSISVQDSMVADAYRHGVPMGSDLKLTGGRPEFLVWAARDPDAADLDRIQIIKGWCGSDGAVYEEIYDVALSDGRVLNDDGSVPDNGATVDRKTGEWSKDKGAEELKVIWTDEDFDPKAYAFYYVRVLEMPTASWRLWDKIRYGLDYTEKDRLVIQERAWSSPIWYTPTE